VCATLIITAGPCLLCFCVAAWAAANEDRPATLHLPSAAP
jgi:hypothetical protein